MNLGPFQIETQRAIVSFYHGLGGGDVMPAVVKAFIERHIQHLKYPSKKSEIVAACAGMAEMPKADKEWIEQNLPDGNYKSADEVIRALKL
jgi:hypothetical protein